MAYTLWYLSVCIYPLSPLMSVVLPTSRSVLPPLSCSLLYQGGRLSRAHFLSSPRTPTLRPHPPPPSLPRPPSSPRHPATAAPVGRDPSPSVPPTLSVWGGAPLAVTTANSWPRAPTLTPAQPEAERAPRLSHALSPTPAGTCAPWGSPREEFAPRPPSQEAPVGDKEEGF